jgi:hypothetical protein
VLFAGDALATLGFLDGKTGPHTATVIVTGSGFSPDAKLSGPKGVTFSRPMVSSDGTTITTTATVAATAPAGTNLPITVRDGALGSYGSATDKTLTIS